MIVGPFPLEIVLHIVEYGILGPAGLFGPLSVSRGNDYLFLGPKVDRSRRNQTLRGKIELQLL